MATRAYARLATIQLLYAHFSGNDARVFLDEYLKEHKIKNAQAEFAKGAFLGVLEHCNELDCRIAAELKGWDFARLGEIEKAILRLCSWELIFADLAPAVAINEAIEIAKDFELEDPGFLNGVLDGVFKNKANPPKPMPKPKENTEDSIKKDSIKRNFNAKNNNKKLSNKRNFGAKKPTEKISKNTSLKTTFKSKNKLNNSHNKNTDSKKIIKNEKYTNSQIKKPQNKKIQTTKKKIIIAKQNKENS